MAYKDEKFTSTKLAVFAMMTEEKRESVSLDQNPFIFSVQRKVRRFRRDAIYYDFGEPTEFNNAFRALQSDGFCTGIWKLEAFQTFLVRRMIADVYHVNSYVQESLVDIYRTVDEIIHLLRQPRGSVLACSLADDLFHRLANFEDRLEESLQRGSVRWGFIKLRKLAHWDGDCRSIFL